MSDRLILGCGSLGQTVVEAVASQPGALSVLTPDERRAEALLDEGLRVEVGDPTAISTLRELDPPETVIVACENAQQNVAAALAAREAFPDAFLLAYRGTDGRGQPATIEELADRVVDPASATASFLMDRVGDTGIRLRQLQRILRGIDQLAVVTHDNPDPDAIGSAVALARLAERAGCDTDVCYYGDITHHENRAFVNLLDFDLRNLGPETDLSAYDGFALVDHSRPGVNDQLPPDLPVDIVIDHHPPRMPVEARFVDLRSEVGATSTLLVDYLEHFGMGFSKAVATGLLFGIRVDTREFTREVSRADFEAAATLLPHADLGTLERIESPSISPETFDTMANAITNRTHEGEIVLSCVGQLTDRDALAQAADRLLTLDDVTTTLVYGVRDGTIYASARSRGTDVDLGETLRDAFGPIGSAGGHADMAGAQIALGVLEAVEDREESLLEIVEAVVTARFLEALEARTSQTVAGLSASDHDADEYLVPEDQLPGTRGGNTADTATGTRATGEPGQAPETVDDIDSGTDTAESSQSSDDETP
jgi:nanoRNase/pAp phosphatase (c-di-AMP/oligoRNAs hydrolase)